MQRQPIPVTTLFPYRQSQPESRARRLLIGLLLTGLLYGFYFGQLAPFLVMPFLVPIALLAGLVIWALPAGRPPEAWTSRLLIAFLVVLPLWPNYLAVALPGMPWITMSRIIGAPMILLLLICLSVSAEFRRAVRDSLDAIGPAWRMLAVFVLLQFLSLPLAVIHGGGVGDAVEAFVVAQINCTAVFFLGAAIFLRPGRASFLVNALIVAAFALCMIGLVEWRQGAVPWAGHIPSFLKVQDPLVEKVLGGSTRAASGIHRVQASYTTSLGFAEFLALMTPFVLHLAVAGGRVATRLAAAAFLPLLFWTILLTDSRLGVIGFFLSLLFYLFIHGVMKWRRERRSLIGPAIVLAYPMLFAGFLTATVFVGRLSRMVWGGGAASYSTQARIEQYDKGFGLFLQNPLGYGIGRGGITLGYSNQAGVGTIDTYYLLILLEYGAIGFLLFYGLFLAGLWKMGKTLFGQPLPGRGEESLLVPLAIAIGNWIVIKSIFAQDDNHPLIFAMLGMAAALLHRIERVNPEGGWPRTAGRARKDRTA